MSSTAGATPEYFKVNYRFFRDTKQHLGAMLCMSDKEIAFVTRRRMSIGDTFLFAVGESVLEEQDFISSAVVTSVTEKNQAWHVRAKIAEINSKEDVNRRNCQRHPVKLYGTCRRITGQSGIECLVTDISSTGMAVESEMHIRTDDIVEIIVKPCGKALEQREFHAKLQILHSRHLGKGVYSCGGKIMSIAFDGATLSD